MSTYPNIRKLDYPSCIPAYGSIQTAADQCALGTELAERDQARRVPGSWGPVGRGPAAARAGSAPSLAPGQARPQPQERGAAMRAALVFVAMLAGCSGPYFEAASKSSSAGAAGDTNAETAEVSGAAGDRQAEVVLTGGMSSFPSTGGSSSGGEPSTGGNETGGSLSGGSSSGGEPSTGGKGSGGSSSSGGTPTGGSSTGGSSSSECSPGELCQSGTCVGIWGTCHCQNGFWNACSTLGAP
jgi:hypothetical protein